MTAAPKPARVQFPPKLRWSELPEPTEAQRYRARGSLCWAFEVLLASRDVMDPYLNDGGPFPDEAAREIIERVVFFMEDAARLYGCELKAFIKPHFGSEESP